MLHRLIGIKKYLALAVVLFAVQCGGKSKSSKVSFDLVPKRPIVITAPTSSGTEEIPAPWFSFRVTATNDSDEVVTIVAIELELSIIDERGSEKTGKVAFSPGENNHQITVANTTYDCIYTTYAELQPGTSAEMMAEPSGPAQCATYQGFLVFGIPKTESNFRYKVKMKPIGWFGPYDSPTDRFERKVIFFTQ